MADGKDGEDPRVAANRVCSDDASQELVEDYLEVIASLNTIATPKISCTRLNKAFTVSPLRILALDTLKKI